MTCSICFDDMDMKEYKDEQECTLTCFKLECGHAYHTKCIITLLTGSESKCPTCNSRTTPKKKLEHQAVVKKMLREVKLTQQVQVASLEYKAAKKEMEAVVKQMKADTIEWIQKRTEELKIKEIRDYFIQSMSNVRATVNTAARLKGQAYVGALEELKSSVISRRRWGSMRPFEEYCFGQVRHWRLYRLKNPGIYVKLFQSKKK